MARITTTKPQTTGHRFLVRRMDNAVIQRDTRMLHAPMGMQSGAFWAGFALGAAAIGIAIFMAWLSPQALMSNVRIASADGSLFVMYNNKLHPVLNLTSAKLITNDNSAPEQIKPSELSKYARGLPMGIPNAPSNLTVTSDDVARLTACDQTTKIDNSATTGSITTTSIIGPLTDPKELKSNQAIIASLQGDKSNTLWFIDSKDTRRKLDRKDYPTMTAIGAANAQPIQISQALFNAIPEGSNLSTPFIAGAGKPFPFNKDWNIGGVLDSKSIQGVDTYYAVLSDGLEQVSPVIADILKEKYSTVYNVNSSDAASYKKSNQINTGPYPDQTPQYLDPTPAVLCYSWSKSATDVNATTRIYYGQSLPLSQKQIGDITRYTPHTGTQIQADQALVPPGAGWWLQVTNNTTDPILRGQRLFLDDTGIRYSVVDPIKTNKGTSNDPAEALGFSNTPLLVPDSLISLFAQGPALSKQDALTYHENIVDSDQSSDGN